MSFTRSQQPAFQQLHRRAWAVEAPLIGCDPADKVSQRAWYEEQLYKATGQMSSTECNATRDYERAMAHFEMLEGAGIYWQMRAVKGSGRRILHEVKQLAAEFECDDAYMLGIARQALRRETIPAWEELRAEDLLVILRALKLQVRRQSRRGDSVDQPRREADPF